MKKLSVCVWCFLMVGMIGVLPARAMHEKDAEDRIEALSARIEALEKTAADKQASSRWMEVFSFSGLLEAEAGYEKLNPEAAGEPTDKSSDVTLATMQLGVDATLNEHVSGHVLFLWEQDDTEPVDLDEGFVTISGGEQRPVYVTAGKYYLPFGNYETHFISDPFTLELGEANESAVMCGYHGALFDINAGAFNGDINQTDEDDHVENAFAGASFTLPDDWAGPVSLTAGISYISSIADTDGLSGEIAGRDGEEGTGGLKDDVGGMAGYVTIGFEDRAFFKAGYVGALDEFEPGELAFVDGKAKPSAWNFEAAYVTGSRIGAGLKYEGTDDCGDFLPETGFGAIIFWYPFEQTFVGLEYMHQEYDTRDIGQNLTAQLAYEF
ncbi:MAG: LbtU family siderophore porin [Thermodesulfobacteriota bacterium]